MSPAVCHLYIEFTVRRNPNRRFSRFFFTCVALISVHASALGYIWWKQAQKWSLGETVLCVKALNVRGMARKSNSFWVYVRTGCSSGSCFGTASSTVCSVKSSGWVTQESSLPKMQVKHVEHPCLFVSLTLHVTLKCESLELLCKPCWMAAKDCRPEL